jgi:hypothetical protein
VEHLPLITAVVSVIAGAWVAAALLLREWLWLRYCRWVHDVAVVKGLNPDPEKIIKAASQGRLGHPHELGQLIANPVAGKKASTSEQAA